jgi:outer membrane protein assembly factor BamB
MKRLAGVAAGVALTLMAGDLVRGQGRGGQNWNTTSADAQRTGWLRTETRISAETLRTNAGGFQLLWKVKPENRPRQLNTLTQPLILGNLISHRGFKSLAFFGGSDDVVYAYDYDLGTVYWSQKLNTAATGQPGTSACPGGLTTITRSTPLAQSAIPARGVGAGIAGPPPGGRPPQTGINPANLPITGAVWAISSSGMVHALNPHIGADLRRPVRIVPAGAKVSGSVLVDDVLYATTTDGCGGAPNGLWALDVAQENASAKAKVWESGGASIAGTTGPTLGLNNVIYVATGAGAGKYPNAVVAIDPKTLEARDWFTGDSPFTTSPVAFSDGTRDLVAAAAKDGRLYVFDGKTPGGADHRTPLARSPIYSSAAGEFPAGAVTTWQDAQGARWLLVASTGPLPAGTTFKTSNGAVTNGTIAAFRLVNQSGALSLEPAWSSRDLTSPATPIVLNDVVFALSSGAFRGDAQTAAAQRLERSAPAVLYALDAKTGKELWTSGRAIAASVQGVGPSGQDGQVYVVAADGTLYAFGIPMEH